MAKSSTVLTIAIIMLLLAFAPSIEGKPTGKADASGGCTCHYAAQSVTANHNFPTTYTSGTIYNIQITMQGGVVGAQGGFALQFKSSAASPVHDKSKPIPVLEKLSTKRKYPCPG